MFAAKDEDLLHDIDQIFAKNFSVEAQNFIDVRAKLDYGTNVRMGDQRDSCLRKISAQLSQEARRQNHVADCVEAHDQNIFDARRNFFTVAQSLKFLLRAQQKLSVSLRRCLAHFAEKFAEENIQSFVCGCREIRCY